MNKNVIKFIFGFFIGIICVSCGNIEKPLSKEIRIETSVSRATFPDTSDFKNSENRFVLEKVNDATVSENEVLKQWNADESASVILDLGEIKLKLSLLSNERKVLFETESTFKIGEDTESIKFDFSNISKTGQIHYKIFFPVEYELSKVVIENLETRTQQGIQGSVTGIFENSYENTPIRYCLEGYEEVSAGKYLLMITLKSLIDNSINETYGELFVISGGFSSNWELEINEGFNKFHNISYNFENVPDELKSIEETINNDSESYPVVFFESKRRIIKGLVPSTDLNFKFTGWKIAGTDNLLASTENGEWILNKDFDIYEDVELEPVILLRNESSVEDGTLTLVVNEENTNLNEYLNQNVKVYNATLNSNAYLSGLELNDASLILTADKNVTLSTTSVNQPICSVGKSEAALIESKENCSLTINADSNDPKQNTPAFTVDGNNASLCFGPEIKLIGSKSSEHGAIYVSNGGILNVRGLSIVDCANYHINGSSTYDISNSIYLEEGNVIFESGYSSLSIFVPQALNTDNTAKNSIVFADEYDVSSRIEILFPCNDPSLISLQILIPNFKKEDIINSLSFRCVSNNSSEYKLELVSDGDAGGVSYFKIIPNNFAMVSSYAELKKAVEELNAEKIVIASDIDMVPDEGSSDATDNVINVSRKVEIVAADDKEIKLNRTSGNVKAAFFSLSSSDAVLDLGSEGGKLIFEGNGNAENPVTSEKEFIIASQGELTLGKNLVVQNYYNSDSWNGSAGSISSSGAKIYVNGATFRNNSSTHDSAKAGAIYIKGGSFIMEDGTFTGNTGTSAGAICVGETNSSTIEVNIKNGNFSGNKSSKGSSLSLCNTNYEISNVTFDKNIGVACYITTGSEGSVSQCNFMNNTAENAGGAIYIGNSSTSMTTISNCSFEGNSATGSNSRGGAICVGSTADDSEILIENCTFNNNKALQGAAISNYVSYGLMTVKYSSFSENGLLEGTDGELKGCAIYSMGKIKIGGEFDLGSSDLPDGIYIDKNAQIDICEKITYKTVASGSSNNFWITVSDVTYYLENPLITWDADLSWNNDIKDSIQILNDGYQINSDGKIISN